MSDLPSSVCSRVVSLQALDHEGNCSTGFGLGCLGDTTRSTGSPTDVLGLGEQEDVDVGENTARSDGSAAHHSVELIVVADSELDVSWHDSALLVVLGGVASEFEDLSGEVLKDGGEIDWGASSNAFSISALLQIASNSADWELKSSLGCSGYGTGGALALSSSSFSCHC